MKKTVFIDMLQQYADAFTLMPYTDRRSNIVNMITCLLERLDQGIEEE